MGFGKRGYRFPEKIEQLDFHQLHNSQYWVLADWMHSRRQVNSDRSGALGDSYLRDLCLLNLPRAQQGYEIIVLGMEPAATTGKGDTTAQIIEKRLTQVLMEIINQNRDEMSQVASGGVELIVKAVKKQLDEYAGEALKTASEKYRPLAIVQEGKKLKKLKGVLPPEFERMVQLASARIPIMMVGPAGCGKTYLAGKLAEALELEYSDQSCSEGMSESVFNGLLLPIGKAGEFKHVTSPFMDRYENGGLMLLDEMDAGDPNLYTYINKAIANESYTVVQRFLQPVVKKHEDFVLVTAANTFGHGADTMYVGRNQLDAATLDRFKVGLVTMDYCQEVEMSIAGDDALTDWAWKIRQKIRENKLRRVMSTRVIKDLGEMTRRYKWKQKEWEEAYFTGWSEADRRLVA